MITSDNAFSLLSFSFRSKPNQTSIFQNFHFSHFQFLIHFCQYFNLSINPCFEFAVDFIMWTLFYYSVLMFTVPFAVFFLAKHICEDIYHLDIFATNVISVVCAVVAVNVIIFFYVSHNMKRQMQLREEEEKSKTD